MAIKGPPAVPGHTSPSCTTKWGNNIPTPFKSGKKGDSDCSDPDHMPTYQPIKSTVARETGYYDWKPSLELHDWTGEGQQSPRTGPFPREGKDAGTTNSKGLTGLLYSILQLLVTPFSIQSPTAESWNSSYSRDCLLSPVSVLPFLPPSNLLF